MPNFDLPFSDDHIDVFTEIASMGTAHAATALSKMIGKKVFIASPNTSWVDFQHVSDFVGGPDNVIVGILLSLSGDMKGMLIYLMELQSANMVADAVLGQSQSKTPGIVFTEMEASALHEMGNIMVGSYINPLADLVKCKITISPPSLAVDMANAILSVPIIEFGKLADKVLLIQSKLTIDNINFSGCFAFMPDIESFKQLLDSFEGD